MTETITAPHPTTTWDGRLGRAHATGVVWRAGGGPVGAALGLPRTGDLAGAELSVEAGADGDDRWTRRFGRRRWTTVCTPTPTGFVEWVGPGRHRHRLGLELAVAVHGDRATIRLRALRLGSRRIGRPFGLRVDAVVDSVGDGIEFLVAVTLAGRGLVAYEGWLR
jgi:hypothetical protein